jgi:hypothetical protein
MSLVIGAASPHRFALHRRQRVSSALLLIASLRIVDSAHRITVTGHTYR